MGYVQVAYLFIYFFNGSTTLKYNIIEQYTFTKKKREKEEKLFSEVAREEEKFHKFLHSFTVHF